MAQRRQPIVDEPIFFDTPSAIEKALAGLGTDNGKITLSRMPGSQGGRPAYLCELTPQEFHLEWVKQNYGGGRFKIVAVDDDGDEKVMLFEIEGDPIKVKLGDDFQVPNSMEERIAHIEELLKTPKQDQGMAILLAMLPMLLQRQDNEEQFLKKLQLYKTVLSPDQTKLDAKSIMELIRDGMELGNGEGGSTLFMIEKIIEKIYPLVQPVMESIARKQPGPNMRLQNANLNPSVTTGATGTTEIKAVSGMQAYTSFIKPFLPTLILAASMNKDPNDVADMINAIPQDKKQQAIELLNSPTWFQDLATMDQRIVYQQAWWEELRTVVLAHLMGKPEIETPEDGEEQL